MKANIILNLEKLNKIKDIHLQDFIELDMQYHVVANKTIVHEEFHSALFATNCLASIEELNSKLSEFGHDIDIIVKSLNKLNIEPDILIELKNIDLQPFVSPSDLD